MSRAIQKFLKWCCTSVFIWSSIIVPVNSVAQESGVNQTSPEMSLAPLLKSQFSIDVDIGTGNGTRADPIVVLATSDADASETELLVLRGIGKVRGMMWRMIERSIVQVNESPLLQRKIETKSIEDGQLVTQVENFYFSRPNAPLQVSGRDSHVIAHRDPDAGLVFPYEIGWLHFDKVVTYPSASLGYSLAYNAPGIKATVYIYPRDSEVDISEAVRNEINQTRSDILNVQGANNIKELGEISYSEDMANYLFVDLKEDNSDLEEDEFISNAFIYATPTHFIKVRATFVSYEFVIDAFFDFQRRIYSLAK